AWICVNSKRWNWQRRPGLLSTAVPGWSHPKRTAASIASASAPCLAASVKTSACASSPASTSSPPAWFALASTMAGPRDQQRRFAQEAYLQAGLATLQPGADHGETPLPRTAVRPVPRPAATAGAQDGAPPPPRQGCDLRHDLQGLLGLLQSPL